MRFVHNIPTLIARQRRMYQSWAQSLSIDLSQCQHERVDNKSTLREFVVKSTHFFQEKSNGPVYIDRFEDKTLHLVGYTAMTLHDTFSIVVHLDEVSDRAFIDIFSCNDFDSDAVVAFCTKYFAAEQVKYTKLDR